jgi:subtilase family serine protease
LRKPSRFGIPVAGLEVVSSIPGSPSAALASPEEVLDVEMVHAIAPGAGIRVVPVEVMSEGTVGGAVAAMLRALKDAVVGNLGDVISLSIGVEVSSWRPRTTDCSKEYEVYGTNETDVLIRSPFTLLSWAGWGRRGGRSS